MYMYTKRNFFVKCIFMVYNNLNIDLNYRKPYKNSTIIVNITINERCIIYKSEVLAFFLLDIINLAASYFHKYRIHLHHYS